MTAETTDAGTPPPSTRPLLATITVPETPHSIAMSQDGARAYVSHFRSGSVSLIDTATETVTAVLHSEPGAYGVAPAADDSVVHVAHPMQVDASICGCWARGPSERRAPFVAASFARAC